MSAKEILYKKCEEKGGCFLSGQVGWIVEAMEQYAEYVVKCRGEWVHKDSLPKPPENGTEYFEQQMQKIAK